MDVMVTARMSQAKKEAGAAVLAKLDMNASQVINKLYDYMIRYRRLPFGSSETSETDIMEAVLWVNALISDDAAGFGRLASVDIKGDRLRTRSLG